MWQKYRWRFSIPPSKTKCHTQYGKKFHSRLKRWAITNAMETSIFDLMILSRMTIITSFRHMVLKMWNYIWIIKQRNSLNIVSEPESNSLSCHILTVAFVFSSFKLYLSVCVCVCMYMVYMCIVWDNEKTLLLPVAWKLKKKI